MNFSISNLMPSLLKQDTLKRYGSDNDGGYIFPKNIVENSKTLISLGIKDNWSFERDYVRLGKKNVFAFDLVTDLTFFVKCSVVYLLKLKIKKSFTYFWLSFQFLLFFKTNQNVKFFKKGIANNKEGFMGLRELFEMVEVKDGRR